ncbi:Hypothetical predicted protein, partial [Paramuricea clavata]
MALQGRKLMKPKKQVALKFKTLTLTLALATGINITNGFATEATDAEKVTAFGAAVEDFLKDYKSTVIFKSVEGTGVNEGKASVAGAKGVYNATGGGTSTPAVLGITGGIDLKGDRLQSLATSATALDEATGAVAK